MFTPATIRTRSAHSAREGAMRAAVAIVESAVDVKKIEAAIVKAHAAVLEAEENLEQRQIELGQLLCDLRKTYPERAKPGERSWTDFLAEKSIPSQRASESMDSYRSTLTPDSGNSNDDDDSEPDEDKDSNEEPFHILIASGEFRAAIKRHVDKWPAQSRPSIPSLLRDLADEIEAEI